MLITQVSIALIIQTTESFDFSHTPVEEVLQTISTLDSSKKVSGDIPIKLLKLGKSQCAPMLTQYFNSFIDKSYFPDESKRADIIPIHKKGDTTNKENYRPISLLPAISKVFEKIICKQLNEFMDKKPSKHLCGFRKGHSTQYSLLFLLNKWQKCLHNRGKIGAILMDLSKAFDCLPQDLLIAKLKAYGVGNKSSF